MDGGNAFDAAVATAVTLGVVEPYMSGVGGIGLALAYVAAEDRVRALNFSGRAPKAAHPSRFTDDSKEAGVLAPLVPGNVAGWLTLHDRWGSLDRERLFMPAINYAQNGFPLTDLGRFKMASLADRLHPDSASIVFGRGGQLPQVGQLLRMPQLAESLRKIAKHGQDVFYKGELADRIIDANQSAGGLFTAEDFAEYQPEWQDPIGISYRGHQVYTTPPNSSGFQVLQTLKLMEGIDVSDLAYQDSRTLHVLMEAVKLCVTDRIKYSGDPDYVRVPIRGLLSEAYAASQRQRIDRNEVSRVSGEHYVEGGSSGALAPGSPEEFDGGMTTHFAVADRDGNVVCVTQTIGGAFGSGVIAGDTGILLNNMCYWFDLAEESPNVIGPGKRVDFVLAPTITLRNGRVFLSMGTPGSWGILQTTPQLLMNVLDFEMSVQQAIEAPRFRYYTGRRVEMEERYPLHVRSELQALGHQVAVIDGWSASVGGAQAIRVDASEGVFHGGADPRREGFAVGW
jgi:gamma-glutamyltranspeptidase/glutathione hydrolase